MASLWSRWLRSCKPTASQACRQHRPRLEVLEDRLTPATFLVNTTLDTVAVNLATGQDSSGNISLRSAIQAANSASNAGDDTIVLPAGTYTRTLTGSGEDAAATGDLDIVAGNGKLTITGAGADVAIIDAAGIDRVFEVRTSANLDLSGVTIRGGATSSGGGSGILNSGTLTVSGSTLSGNSATTQGGGIFNSGTLTVSGSTLSGNSAVDSGGGIANTGAATVSGSTVSGNSGTFFGGGIYNSGGTLTVSGSTLSGNSGQRGGGIYNQGTATVSGSTLSGNAAILLGGGINHNSGTLTVSGSTVSGNSAGENGGGIFNTGTLTVSGSTVSGNAAILLGGGINTTGAATVTVSGSTFSGNSSANGGGIFIVNGTLTVSGSTLSGNSAVDDGGAIYINAGTATVSGSTLSGNSAGSDGGGILIAGGIATVSSSTLSGNSAGSAGGGIFNFGTATTLRNSILAGNTASTGPNFRLTVISSGNNLVDNDAGSSGWIGSDLLNVDALLGPLTNNGGPTLTHALLAGSPALDAGNNTGSAALDQRGFNRIKDGPDADTTATVDIGAFEAQIWMADIADQATNEDTPLAFNFATSLGIANVTATSDNPALVRAANIAVTGAGASRTLTITPLANQSGTALITVTVSDGTSSMTDTFELTVNPVNDAPVLDNSSVMRLQAINEDDVGSFGTRVSDIILSAGGDRITDLDAGAAEGMAITNVNNSNGTWQFSTDSAATWTNFGTLSATAARLLTAGAFVRFVPNANFNGTADFTFQAWDQTSGANGGTADTSANSGSTAFSTAGATATITVLAVNDAPVNTVPPAQKTTVNKPLVFSGARRILIADVDAGIAIMRVTLTVTNGTLVLGTTAGLASVTGNGTAKITLTGTLASINTALNNLRYRPSAGFRGKAKLTITTEDLGNSGLGGPKKDTDAISISVV